MSKTDIEVLMFSLFINRLLDVEGDEDYRNFSDYTLAKDLGITQSKVSSLKLKQQLQYPREYKWRDALARISNNVRYENGKLKLQIPDINLFYEIKNAVEENGGFIDISLTPKLLQVSPDYFLDLLVAISPEESRESLRKELRKELRAHTKDQEYLDNEPFGKKLAKGSKDVAIEVVSAVANAAIGNIIGAGTSLATIASNCIKAFQ